MGAVVDPLASMVGGLFGGNKSSGITPPAPPTPPPAMPPAYVPPIGVAGAQPGAAGGAGFGGTIITGPQGLKQPESTTNKQLLGG